MPGISPKTIGPPTSLISTSCIAPLPTRTLYFSSFIFFSAALTMKLCRGKSRGQALSQRAHPIHSSYRAANFTRSPSAATANASGIGRSFGHALLHSSHCRHLLACSNTSPTSGSALNFDLFGATAIAVLAATSPTLVGSKMSAPAMFPFTKSSTILSGSSFVRSGSPRQFLSLEAIKGAFIF